MASSPVPQVHESAVDASGLSISVAAPSGTDGRLGTVYDPAVMAAAVPVHFHPFTNTSLGGQDFLMLSSSIWTAATVASAGQYSAHTAVNTPTWVMVNAANGTKSLINGSIAIPMKTPVTSSVLTAAVSRGNDMLWTLNNTSAGAIAQHWHVNTALNTVNLFSEEILPTATNGPDTITFSAGLHYSYSTTPYTYAYGLGSSTSHVYQARKQWAQVGHVAVATGLANAPTSSTSWEVWTGTGWDPDPSKAQPLTSSGAPLSSLAPLSFAHYGLVGSTGSIRPKRTGYTLMSVVTQTSGTYHAQLYTSLGGRDWTPYQAPISLGGSGVYVGGNIQLQPQIGPNPSLITGASAIPYVVTTQATSGSNLSLVNTWGLIQVPVIS